MPGRRWWSWPRTWSGGASWTPDAARELSWLARRWLGDDVDLRQARLGGAPLPFGDGTFDDVVSLLVLHYVEDWTEPLTDLRRLLKTGGRLIVAVNHPFVYPLTHPAADYLTLAEFSEGDAGDCWGGVSKVVYPRVRALHHPAAVGIGVFMPRLLMRGLISRPARAVWTAWSS